MSATWKKVAASSAFFVLTTGWLFVQPARATVLIQIDDTTSSLGVNLNTGQATCSITLLGSSEQLEVDCPLPGVIGAITVSTPTGDWDITLMPGLLDISATIFDSPTVVSDIVDLHFTSNASTNTTAFHFNFESCGATAPCGLVALGPGALESALTYSAIVSGIGPEPIDVEVKFAPDARVVPEPSVLMLVGLGFAGLAWNRYRKIR